MITVVPSAMEPNMMLRWEMDLSPGTVISPFKCLLGQIVLTLIDNVPEFLQNLRRLLRGCLVVEFNAQNPFFKFSVMYDPDILKIQAVGCQDRRDRRLSRQ